MDPEKSLAFYFLIKYIMFFHTGCILWHIGIFSLNLTKFIEHETSSNCTNLVDSGADTPLQYHL